jgi:hypothetical protein
MFDKPKVLGLCGRAYAGKTTVAEHVAQKYGFVPLAFADSLKSMLITAGLCTYNECYVEKTERSRELMQKIGTEIFRKQVHADFWVQQTAKRVAELMRDGHSVVLHDIRFPNEARLVNAYMDAGLLIKLMRVNADGSQWLGAHSEDNQHESETAVDGIAAIEAKELSGDVALLKSTVEVEIERRWMK